MYFGRADGIASLCIVFRLPESILAALASSASKTSRLIMGTRSWCMILNPVVRVLHKLVIKKLDKPV